MIKRICLIFIIFLGTIFSTSYCRAAGADINKMLDNAPWTAINQRENVKYKPANWRSSDDLSFKYKIVVSGGTIYVRVSVKDDKVVLKENGTVTSDHVEIWVADPRLTAETNTSLADIRKLEGELTDRLEVPEEFSGTIKLLKDALADLKKIEGQYKNNRFYVQLIFNKSNLLSIPENPAVHNATYHYRQNADGYDFQAEIPVAGICDYKASEIRELSYLIDVVDIDDIKTKQQKTLMSSSVNRRYSDPATFNTITLRTIYDLPLPTLEGLKERLIPVGYYKTSNGQYVYQVKNTHQFGYYKFDRFSYDGFYSPLVLTDISRTPELKVYPHDKALLVLKNDKYAIIDLGNGCISAEGFATYKLLFQNVRLGKIYLLLDVGGSTYSLGGSGTCGAGEEFNLVWIALDESLTPFQLKSKLYESCRDNLYVVPIPVRENQPRYQIENNRLKFNFSSSSAETPSTFYYDNNNPELGFTITPMRADSPEK